MTLSKLEYDVVHECVFGPEPVSIVLISAFTEQGHSVDEIIDTLVKLLKLSFIEMFSGPDGDTLVESPQATLMEYLDRRQQAGENLAEWPRVCDELLFMTTDKGIAQLRLEHRPV